MSPRLPPPLQAAYIGAIVAAALVGCCALYSGIGVVAQQMFAGRMGELSDGAATVERFLEIQRVMSILSIVLLVLQIGTSISLAVGGGIGLSGRPLGRPLTLAAFALVILGTLADGGVAIWSWSTMGDLMGVGASDLGAEGSRAMAIAGAVGLLPTGCWMVFKLALVIAGTAALLSPPAGAFYAQMGPEGLVRGPRE